MTDKTLLAIDFGGTKIEAALVNSNGTILKKSRVPTTAERGQEAVIADVLSLIDAFKDDRPAGLTIGFAGQVDSRTGFVYSAPNLGWKNVQLGKILTETSGLKTLVINDVRAALYGEWKHGAAIGLTDFILIFFGTGIGGGIVCNGQVVAGANGTAGEIGHLYLNALSNTFEKLAGGRGIEKQAEEKLKRKISAKELIEMYRRHDPIAVSIIDQAKGAVSNAMISLANLLNPSHIIFGGGLLDGLPEIIDEASAAIKQHALSPNNQAVCLKAKLGGDAPLLGAAYAFDTYYSSSQI